MSSKRKVNQDKKGRPLKGLQPNALNTKSEIPNESKKFIENPDSDQQKTDTSYFDFIQDEPLYLRKQDSSALPLINQSIKSEDVQLAGYESNNSRAKKYLGNKQSLYSSGTESKNQGQNSKLFKIPSHIANTAIGGQPLQPIQSEQSLPDVHPRDSRSVRELVNYSQSYSGRPNQGRFSSIGQSGNTLLAKPKFHIASGYSSHKVSKTQMVKYREGNEEISPTLRQNLDIEIGSYLAQKIDTQKLNVKVFQNKIRKFQNLYGLGLIDPIKKPIKNQQKEIGSMNADIKEEDEDQKVAIGGRRDSTGIDRTNVSVQDPLKYIYENSKTKHNQKGLDFYRVRAGINDLPKIRFQKPEIKSFAPDTSLTKNYGSQNQGKSTQSPNGDFESSEQKINQLDDISVSGTSNMIYTLVSPDQLDGIEQKIRMCLLELVKVTEANEIANESSNVTDSAQTSGKKKQEGNGESEAGSTVFVPIIRLRDQHPLFNKLSNQGVRALLSIGQIITLTQNQVLFKEHSMQYNSSINLENFRLKKFYVIMYGNFCYQSQDKGLMACFGIGSVIGEEWIFKKDFTQRSVNCFAKTNSCVLEISNKQYEFLREFMAENGFKKDLSILESILKRNYILKKGFQS